jgi:5-methylcytosine-specific restriction endonuclease McrA
MRIEIILFLIASFLIANIYTDGRILKTALSWKKYYQMAGIAFAAYLIYWLVKRNPTNAKNIILTSNEYLKYLPVDKNATSIISPILDFTANGMEHVHTGGAYNHPVLSMKNNNQYEKKLMNSGMNDGKKATKRSVSETKKKFVAAKQNWKCQNCNRQLPAWFEVDHVVRLEHGGSNHVDNLVALCRDCHGEKTAIENL